MKKMIVALGFLVASTSFAEIYIVKKGDTLASIARSYYGEPVFGPKGSINKIYQFNPWSRNGTVPIEPGQEVRLADKVPNKLSEKTAAAVEVPPIPEPTSAPVAAPAPSEPTPEKVATPSEPAPVEASPAAVSTPPVTSEPKAPEPSPSVNSNNSKPNYFSIIPSFSKIKQSATENASGTEFSFNSNSTLGLELGWDRGWNDSFSTILTYSISQLTSSEKSLATDTAIVDKVLLSRTELALMNRFGTRLRFGLGAAYADHLFLEDLLAVAGEAKTYKTAFWNSFVAAEMTLMESPSLDVLLNLKSSFLPAQVGTGHDLTSGTEYFAQISFLQKFEDRAFLYGMSYATDNQTRTDAKETRTETALKLGLLF